MPGNTPIARRGVCLKSFRLSRAILLPSRTGMLAADSRRSNRVIPTEKFTRLESVSPWTSFGSAARGSTISRTSPATFPATGSSSSPASPGSGKSSLAFDTIFAEGQRRYVESLSAYARQFLEQMEKPDVDSIEGLSPAISIEQRTTSRNPRSTVGTVTEIYDYLRLLYASVGKPHCPKCGRAIQAQTIQEMVDRALRLPARQQVPRARALRRRQEGRVQEADGRDGQGGLPARPRGREDGGPRRSARARQAEEAHDRDRRGPPRGQGRGRRGVPQAPGRLDRDGGAGLRRAHHPVRGGRARGGPVGQLRLPRLRDVADRDHARASSRSTRPTAPARRARASART